VKNKRYELVKILSIFLTLILLFSSFLVIIISSEKIEPIKTLRFTYKFEQPELKIKSIKGVEFTDINIPDVVNFGYKVGEPIQQSKPVKVLLPYQTEVEEINIYGEPIKMDFRSNGIDLVRYPIMPYQSSVPFGEKNSDNLAFNKEVYSQREVIQSGNYEDLGVHSCRGFSILTFNLNPIEYRPSIGMISYYPEITVEIQLQESRNVNNMFRSELEDLEWVKSLVSNPETMDTYPIGKIDNNFYDGGICDPSDNGGLGYDYVIITRDALVDFSAVYNWSDFISRKQAEGLETTIVSYEDIISHPDYENLNPVYNDNPAKVREFCKDAYQDWGLKYVLIAGDDEGVNSIPRREMDSYGEYNVESDLYWSNLDLTFNDDMDNYWGEEGDTGFDLYSELWIGSLPCDEGVDISNWMTKSFYYADSWETDYLDNAAFYGGNTGWSCQGDDFIDFTYYGTDHYYGPDPDHDGPFPDFMGFVYGWDTWNMLHPEMAFNTSVKWTAEPPNPGWQGGSEYAAVAGLKNDINNDLCTLISGIAHASASSSLDVYYDEWESDYHNTKPFFLHDYGCHCGDMDASDDGVLHSMLFHSDTELAFATVYNTGYGWGNLYCTNSSSAWQQKLFWDYMFNLSKCGGIENWQLGKAQAYSKDEMAQMINWDYYDGTFREIIQCCLLFGDPAQLIKTPIIPDKSITNLETNWNFVSIPFNQNVAFTDITVSYDGFEYSWLDATTNNNPTGSPLLEDSIYSWNKISQSYEFADTFKPGEGYWVFSYEPVELWAHDITSSPTNQITNLEQNWNLIGAPTDQTIDLDDIIVTYNGNEYSWSEATTNANPTAAPIIESTVFGWDRIIQSYEFIDSFEPGEGYWLFSFYQCSIKT